MKRFGFTLIELIITVGILTTLLTLTSLNTLFIQHRSQLNSTAATLTSDLRDQQLRAMLGAVSGVYFSSDSYTLFPGLVYDSSNPANFTINLESPLIFTNVTLPNQQLVFAASSGEFTSFSPGANTFILSDPTQSSTKTFTFNRYGVIFSQN